MSSRVLSRIKTIGDGAHWCYNASNGFQIANDSALTKWANYG